MKKEELNNYYKSLLGRDLLESEFSTIRILENSSTADRRKIDNSLPERYLFNALVWHDVFVVAFEYGYTVNSGYRCPELNEIVGGVSTSLHQEALAVDFNVCDDKIIYNRFLESVSKCLDRHSMLIKYHYKRGNMLHVELKFK